MNSAATKHIMKTSNQNMSRISRGETSQNSSCFARGGLPITSHVIALCARKLFQTCYGRSSHLARRLQNTSPIPGGNSRYYPTESHAYSRLPRRSRGKTIALDQATNSWPIVQSADGQVILCAVVLPRRLTEHHASRSNPSGSCCRNANTGLVPPQQFQEYFRSSIQSSRD